jgi:hypothetical protein
MKWFRFTAAAVLLLVLGLMLNGRAEAFSSQVNAPGLAAQTYAVLDGILLTSNVSDADAAYLVENLEFLRDHLPAWWLYLQDAEPLALSVDLNTGAQGRAAYTRCCDGNLAFIVFGFHFDQFSLEGGPANPSPAARRVAFLALLIHEATHVKDQKTGHVMPRADYKSCVAAEHSGLESQLEFKRDVLNISPSDDTIGIQECATEIGNTISMETQALGSRGTWLAYCGDLWNE